MDVLVLFENYGIMKLWRHNWRQSMTNLRKNTKFSRIGRMKMANISISRLKRVKKQFMLLFYRFTQYLAIYGIIWRHNWRQSMTNFKKYQNLKDWLYENGQYINFKVKKVNKNPVFCYRFKQYLASYGIMCIHNWVIL